MKKALVCSGGGNRFLYVLAYLSNKELLNKRGINFSDYSYFSGTSAGALLSLLFAKKSASGIDWDINEFRKINAKDIYSFYPFKNVKIVNDGNNYETKYQLKILLILLRMLLFNKKTLGDTGNLIKSIRNFFTELDFDLIKLRGKDILVTNTNLNTSKLEVYSIYDVNTYDTFIEKVYGSTCAVPIMSLYEKNKKNIIDGGFLENVPISPILNRYNDIEQIDVILMNDINNTNIDTPKNLLDLISSLFNILIYNTTIDDIENALLKIDLDKIQLKNNLKINIIPVFDNTLKNISPFLFDKEIVSLLIDKGISNAEMNVKKLQFNKTINQLKIIGKDINGNQLEVKIL